MRALTFSFFLFTALMGQASASPVSEALTRHLYAGTLAAGDAELEKIAGPEASAARGMLAFVAAIEHLGQAMHRHGLETPEMRAMMQLPIMRLPVPPNPNPEKIDYEKFRAIFARLVEDLDKAEAAMATGRGEVKFTVDLLKVRLDLDGDGKAGDYESLSGMIQALMRGQGPMPGEALVAFDAADVHWLRGYGRFISAFTQFMLAHDFKTSFDKTFHVFFPKAGLPMAGLLLPPAPNQMVDSAIGDAISFIHLINWPVVEPQRLVDVRTRLKAMAALSRESWAAARAETDNDKEWLPNAKQTGAMAPLPVTDEMIDGWLRVMGEFEAVLDGKKTIPHWRFAQGMSLKRLFEESKSFDLVLLITGTDAALFLDNAPPSTDADWNNLMGVFQGNFLGYALWFN